MAREMHCRMEEMTEQQPPKIEFPQADYPIKIIGENAEGFYLQEFVIECCSRHLTDWDSGRLNVRRSSKGNYLAVTVECNIASLAQLKALTKDLQSHPRVRMVL